MAGIEIKGFEELRKNTEHLSKIIATEAIQAAEAAAAEVIKSAMRGAAPRKTGTIARSIRIYKGRNKRLTTTSDQSSQERLLIGPDKRSAYYAFFYEKGRRAFEVKPKPQGGKKALHWRDASGKDIFAKRANVGRQPARPKFESITAQVEKQAQEVGRRAFEEVLNRNLK